jgi:glycosyltransferase involved in cell wall biosynthesis
MTSKIAAIIPCYNEEASIMSTIEAIRVELPDSLIIVVDNGSTDDTIKKAKSAGAKVLQEPLRGKGFAVRRGFSSLPSDVEAIFLVDGDGTYEITPIHLAIPKILYEGFDMVVGKRVVQESSHLKKSGEFRLGHASGNKVLSYLFTKLFNVNLTDTLSGWRLFSAGFVKSFPGGASGFEIEAELNAHSYTLAAAVVEIPVKYRERIAGSESKLRTYKDGWLILRRNLSLYRNERPSIAFNFLALPWVVVSLLLGYPVISEYLETNLVPKFPSLIAAVGAFIIASNLWVTGMILERLRLQRVAMARFHYRSASTS